MDELVIGIDLCDTYTRIVCSEPEKNWTVPTVICKSKTSEQWYVEQEAYEHTLNGDGSMQDRLLTQVSRGSQITIAGHTYEGLYLLKVFLEQILMIPKEAFKQEKIAQLVITLKYLDLKVMDGLLYCADYLNIPRECLHVISHTESFVYYAMSQRRDVWSNQVGMFDLSDETLRYYEMKVQRGLRQNQVSAEVQELEAGFGLDTLEHASGSRVADKTLRSYAEKLLQKRLFSAVILTGKGFEKTEWAPEFMKQICSRRRVFSEDGLFAKGAFYKAIDCMREKTSYPFTCICEGRLKSSISVKILSHEKEGQLLLAAAGDNWYEAKSTVEFLISGPPEIEFTIVPLEAKKKKLVRIALDNFPKRPDRTTRIQVTLVFFNDHKMLVVIKDKGFGEIYAASDAVIRQEVEI